MGPQPVPLARWPQISNGTSGSPAEAGTETLCAPRPAGRSRGNRAQAPGRNADLLISLREAVTRWQRELYFFRELECRGKSVVWEGIHKTAQGERPNFTSIKGGFQWSRLTHIFRKLFCPRPPDCNTVVEPAMKRRETRRCHFFMPPMQPWRAQVTLGSL